MYLLAMKSFAFCLLISLFFGCQNNAEFEKLRLAHCDSIPKTQKVVAEKFTKALEVLNQVDLNSPVESRSDKAVCDQAAIQLQGAIISTDMHQANAQRAGKLRPKDMVLSESGIALNNTSRMIEDFVPTVKRCEIGKIKSLIPWVQTAVKVELAGELKACRLAIGVK